MQGSGPGPDSGAAGLVNRDRAITALQAAFVAWGRGDGYLSSFSGV
jgi:hypothetical protein